MSTTPSSAPVGKSKQLPTAYRLAADSTGPPTSPASRSARGSTTRATPVASTAPIATKAATPGVVANSDHSSRISHCHAVTRTVHRCTETTKLNMPRG